MIPDPIHPAVVHFPIVLCTFLPLVAAAALWAIHTGRLRSSAWLGVVALQALLVVSAWVAVETGESEEDRVERIVAESTIEEHEESAERFLLMAGLALPLAAAGLLRGNAGAAARAVGVVAFLGVLGAGLVTGHRGGELVYRHGAATAYLEQGLAGGSVARAAWESHEEGDEDDDDD
jgi:uncharacterized membrane protein